ncbi:MAG TPA: MFS transporter [Caulobacteraceae bacterium]|nr:MFS transporter [Caulobacteraceae bacterium]
MTQLTPEADLVAVAPEADVASAKLTRGAISWSVFEGARDPYVILIIIYVFMPYVGSVMVGWPKSNPTAGQEVISQWSQYAGWATMATAPFLGASIDQLGRRKGWLGLAVLLMIPLMFALWWAKPDGSGLPIVAVMLMTTVIALLFSYTEVVHNSLLVRAAGMGAAHKASSLALALGNAFALALFLFLAWGFMLPGHVDWSWVPKTPLFGLSQARHEPERLVGPMTAVLLLVGTIPIMLFTPDAPRSGVAVIRAFGDGAKALWRMLTTVGRYRDAAIFLVARSFYVDGMTAVLTFFGIYATGVMKWGALEMLVIGIILTVLAVMGGVLARVFDGFLGPRRAVQMEILMSLLGIIALLGMAPDRILFFWHYDPAMHAPMWNGPFFRTLPEWIFTLIGFSNATFITAHYASSRTLLTRLTPPEQTGAFFGAYAVSGTATSWLAPFMVNLGTHLFKSQQGGFAMITGLLGVGFVGLLFLRKGNRDMAAA